MADARATLDAAMTEADFQEWVIGLARTLGFLVHHVHDSRHVEWSADNGYPDLTLVHRRTGHVVFIELKSNTGRLTDEQRTWGDALALHPTVRYFACSPNSAATLEARLRALAVEPPDRIKQPTIPEEGP